MSISTTSPPSITSLASKPGRIRRPAINISYLFIAPYAIMLIMFGIFPGVYAVIMSFSTFVGGRPNYFTAGLKNYTTAFTDFRFVTAFQNMFTFLAISVPVGIVCVLLLSLLLHARTGFLSTVARTIYFIPGAVAGPVAVLLAIFMFDPNVSPFKPLFSGMGFNAYKDVVRPSHLAVLFTLIGFFAGSGGWVAIFYGALNGISKEVLEAARMDGCNEFGIARHIKLPLIAPYVIYMLILVLAGNVQLFAEPQLMSQASGFAGATVSSNWSPNQLGYVFAFQLGNFGASATISLLMLLIGLVCALIVIRATNFFRTDAFNG